MQLLSVKNAAAVIQTSQHTIRRAIDAGELRWINVSNGSERPRIRIDEADLRSWANSRASKPAEKSA